MQSAGLRTRNRVSMAPSVDDTASVVTLHTIPDSTITPASKSRRTTFAPSRSQPPSSDPSLVIQNPDAPPRSQAPSSNPSLIIQNPDDPSRPPTAEKRKQPARRVKGVKTYHKNFSFAKPEADAGFGIGSANDEEEDEDEDSDLEEPDVTPPKFTIDLSKPPRERYNHVAQHFTPYRIVLEKLFRQIAKETVGWDADKVRKWGRWVFSKLPSSEEEEEIQGIAHVWGVEKFLLVAFNLLLDSFMGCTSGGARVRDPVSAKADTPEATQLPDMWDSTDSRGRMLHFRTLDWQMEDLRKLVCQYEYVAHAGGEIIARQITYFGFVGVLTGVRPGLSISLNFRPCHDASSWWKNLCFRTHQIFVLLGWRQSICSMLRECLLPGKYQPLRKLPTLVDVERDIPSKKTTAAYLIFSDGSRTTTMEVDHRTATVRSASDFIVALNHDIADETQALPERNPVETIDSDPQRERVAHDILSAVGMEGLVACSIDRKTCVADHWRDAKKRRGGTAVHTEDVIEWMKDSEISNDETHYAVIMDPTKGEIVWLRRWLRPLEENDPR